MISFAGGTPHPGDLPLQPLATALEASLAPEALAYGSARGQPSLLAALRGHFAREGIDASPERTMVTSGAMAGLDLVFRCALGPGDGVVVESPTYSDALISLSLARTRIAELPMDAEGAQVEALPDLAAETGRPSVIYVIPTFHNPTGVTMSLERRRRLIDVAHDLGALIVEDDPYSAFRFDGDPLPSLASMSGDVIGVRSLSKIVAPGLRLGCVIGPPAFLALLEQARGGADICSSPLAQEAAARFIREGAVEPHVSRLRDLFAARRDAMLESLSRHFGGRDFGWSRPAGGMFVWVRFPDGFDTARMLEPAMREGVTFVPGSVFSARGRHAGALRLSFAGVETDRIEVGVRRLRAAFDRLTEPGAR